MHLIIGGVWQGKLAYAEQRFGIEREKIFDCTDSLELELDKQCFNHFERYLRACSVAGVPPTTVFPDNAVIICQDIFCGVVSVDPEERAWRELAGRTITAMAARASTVTRIFCGLPMELKT